MALSSIMSVIVLVINLIPMMFLSFLLWQRRSYKGGRYVFALFCTMTFWTLTAIHELTIPSARFKEVVAVATYFAVVVLGPYLLLAMLEYIQAPTAFIKKIKPYLFIVPVITLLAALFNEQFHLLWKDAIADPVNIFTPILYVHGPIFYLNWIYQLVLCSVSILALIQYGILSSLIERFHVAITIIAILLPLFGNIVFNAFLNGTLAYYDITPLFFPLTGLALFYNLFYFQFMSVHKEARDYAYLNMHSGVLVFSPNGVLVDHNKRALQLLESDIATISDLPFSIKHNSGIFLNKKTGKWIEFKVFDLSKSALNGGVAVTLLNINEMKETEAAINHENNLMTSIVDALPMGLFAINADGKVIIWNRFMEELTGYSAQHMFGKGANTVSRAIYGKNEPLLAEAVLQDSSFYAQYQQLKSVGDHLIKTAHLKNRHYLLIATKLKDHSGSVIGAVESVRDITEQHKKELDLEHHLNELVKINEIMGKKVTL